MGRDFDDCEQRWDALGRTTNACSDATLRGYPERESIDPMAVDPQWRMDATLVDFQRDAVREMESHFSQPGRRGILVLPTGGGKTRTALEVLLRRYVAQGKRVLWVTHRIDLLDQVHEELRGLAWILRGLRPRLTVSRCQGPHDDLTGDVVLASSSTMASRRVTHRQLTSDGRMLGIVCYDEAHRATAPETRKALERVTRGEVPMLGLTATPFRLGTGETERLVGFFQRIVYQKEFGELVRNRFLARPVFYMQRLASTQSFHLSQRDIERIQREREIPADVLGRLARHPGRNKEIVDHWIAQRARYGKTLVFACDIAHAKMLVELFRSRRVEAAVLHSELDPVERRRALDAFRTNAIEVLVNVAILTEGANIPDTRTVLMARPTLSRSLYMQMIGRGARGPRAVPGKTEFCVLDCVDNFAQHGFVLAGERVATELGGVFRDAIPSPTEPEPEPRPRPGSRAPSAAEVTAIADLLRLGVDPSRHTFWGELRWIDAHGEARAVAVFREKLEPLRRALAEGISDPSTTLRLIMEGAIRAQDVLDLVHDWRQTGRAPELVEATSQPDHAAAATGAVHDAQQLLLIAESLRRVPFFEVPVLVRAAWREDPRLQQIFPTAEHLYRAVNRVAADLSAEDAAAA